MNREELMARIKRELRSAFGDRYRGVVLYGSEARGEAQPDSDIDLLVLLRGPVEAGRDIRLIVDALYGLELEMIDDPDWRGRTFHALPADLEVYQAARYAIYRNVAHEGIRL